MYRKTILHIYPKDDAQLAQYVSLIVHSDHHAMENIAIDDAKEFKHLCEQHKPHIIHQHGCWQADIISTVAWARGKGIRIVTSLHGQLQSWETEARRLKKAFWGQRQNIQHSYALIARSPMEVQALSQLGWNDRIELIANPLITRTTTSNEMLQKLNDVYDKVLRSNVLELMSPSTTHLFRQLVKAGITGDARWLDQKVEIPEDPHWEQIYLYARYEGMENYIRKGIKVLDLNAPNDDESLSRAYLPNNYSVPKPQQGKTALELIRLAHYFYTKKRLPLLLLAEIDDMLRHQTVDEEFLITELEGYKMVSFTASLMQVMKEQTGLDEGFMPCAPVDNKDTEKIRRIIAQNLLI